MAGNAVAKLLFVFILVLNCLLWSQSRYAHVQLAEPSSGSIPGLLPFKTRSEHNLMLASTQDKVS
jgi:hypothetical protein